MKVLKYKLTDIEVSDRTTILLPDDHKVVHVGFQANKICLWILCDERNFSKKNFTFLTAATGRQLAPNIQACDLSRFIGTAQAPTEEYVWHIFLLK